ncbi:MAG: hypothetical protein QNK37_28685 [Acidobacteriota bacterium]|nr:hypothetical protein [Acidobacteriota bacterium]
MVTEGMQLVRTFLDRASAEAMAGMLEANGIDVTVESPTLYDSTHENYVLVSNDHVAKAREILAQSEVEEREAGNETSGDESDD